MLQKPELINVSTSNHLRTTKYSVNKVSTFYDYETLLERIYKYTNNQFRENLTKACKSVCKNCTTF